LAELVTTAGENTILLDILKQVSQTNIVVARLEEALKAAVSRVEAHDRDIRELERRTTVLESATQKLDLDAKASEAKALALAEALEKDAATRRQKSEATWTPFQRLCAAAAALAAVLGAVYVFTH
jgi:DNA repair ATPase RecN